MIKKKAITVHGCRDEDEFTSTYGTLKQAMRESHELERALIVHELKKELKLWRFTVGIGAAEYSPEWEAGFRAALAHIEELNQ